MSETVNVTEKEVLLVHQIEPKEDDGNGAKSGGDDNVRISPQTKPREKIIGTMNGEAVSSSATASGVSACSSAVSSSSEDNNSTTYGAPFVETSKQIAELKVNSPKTTDFKSRKAKSPKSPKGSGMKKSSKSSPIGNKTEDDGGAWGDDGGAWGGVPVLDAAAESALAKLQAIKPDLVAQQVEAERKALEEAERKANGEKTEQEEPPISKTQMRKEKKNYTDQLHSGRGFGAEKFGADSGKYANAGTKGKRRSPGSDDDNTKFGKGDGKKGQKFLTKENMAALDNYGKGYDDNYGGQSLALNGYGDSKADDPYANKGGKKFNPNAKFMANRAPSIADSTYSTAKKKDDPRSDPLWAGVFKAVKTQMADIKKEKRAKWMSENVYYSNLRRQQAQEWEARQAERKKQGLPPLIWEEEYPDSDDEAVEVTGAIVNTEKLAEKGLILPPEEKTSKILPVEMRGAQGAAPGCEPLKPIQENKKEEFPEIPGRLPGARATPVEVDPEAEMECWELENGEGKYEDYNKYGSGGKYGRYGKGKGVGKYDNDSKVNGKGGKSTGKSKDVLVKKETGKDTGTAPKGRTGKDGGKSWSKGDDEVTVDRFNDLQPRTTGTVRINGVLKHVAGSQNAAAAAQVAVNALNGSQNAAKYDSPGSAPGAVAHTSAPPGFESYYGTGYDHSAYHSGYSDTYRGNAQQQEVGDHLECWIPSHKTRAIADLKSAIEDFQRPLEGRAQILAKCIFQYVDQFSGTTTSHHKRGGNKNSDKCDIGSLTTYLQAMGWKLCSEGTTILSVLAFIKRFMWVCLDVREDSAVTEGMRLTLVRGKSTKISADLCPNVFDLTATHIQVTHANLSDSEPDSPRALSKQPVAGHEHSHADVNDAIHAIFSGKKSYGNKSSSSYRLRCLLMEYIRDFYCTQQDVGGSAGGWNKKKDAASAKDYENLPQSDRAYFNTFQSGKYASLATSLATNNFLCIHFYDQTRCRDLLNSILLSKPEHLISLLGLNQHLKTQTIVKRAADANTSCELDSLCVSTALDDYVRFVQRGNYLIRLIVEAKRLKEAIRDFNAFGGGGANNNLSLSRSGASISGSKASLAAEYAERSQKIQSGEKQIEDWKMAKISYVEKLTKLDKNATDPVLKREYELWEAEIMHTQKLIGNTERELKLLELDQRKSEIMLEDMAADDAHQGSSEKSEVQRKVDEIVYQIEAGKERWYAIFENGMNPASGKDGSPGGVNPFIQATTLALLSLSFNGAFNKNEAFALLVNLAGYTLSSVDINHAEIVELQEEHKAKLVNMEIGELQKKIVFKLFRDPYEQQVLNPASDVHSGTLFKIQIRGKTYGCSFPNSFGATFGTRSSVSGLSPLSAELKSINDPSAYVKLLEEREERQQQFGEQTSNTNLAGVKIQTTAAGQAIQYNSTAGQYVTSATGQARHCAAIARAPPVPSHAPPLPGHPPPQSSHVVPQTAHAVAKQQVHAQEHAQQQPGLGAQHQTQAATHQQAEHHAAALHERDFKAYHDAYGIAIPSTVGTTTPGHATAAPGQATTALQANTAPQARTDEDQKALDAAYYAGYYANLGLGDAATAAYGYDPYAYYYASLSQTNAAAVAGGTTGPVSQTGNPPAAAASQAVHVSQAGAVEEDVGPLQAKLRKMREQKTKKECAYDAAPDPYAASDPYTAAAHAAQAAANAAYDYAGIGTTDVKAGYGPDPYQATAYPYPGTTATAPAAYPAGTTTTAAYPAGTTASAAYATGIATTAAYPAGTTTIAAYPAGTTTTAAYPAGTTASAAYPTGTTNTAAYPAGITATAAAQYYQMRQI